MALVSCPDCGTQVSDQAPACPQCGRPVRGGQPAGGFGAQPPGYPPQQQVYPQQGYPRPASSGMGTGAIIAIVVVVVLVAGIGIFAVLGIYGTRKYIANAKTAEAKNALGQLGKDAITAYEGEGLTDGARHLCASASSPVPANRTAVSGKKYQSSRDEWMKDEARNAGFACLKFEMTAPQYFQYEYTATATGFTARAHGDLNGDGKFSTFELKGEVQNGHLVVAPVITETDPEE